jgi:FkbM family methyltransferase
MSSVRDRVLQSRTLNWAANYVNPRNIGGLLGYDAMAATIELIWKRQLQRQDLTAVLADYFTGTGATVVDIGASWGLFSYHLSRRVGEHGRVISYEPHPENRAVLQKLARAKPRVTYRQCAVSDTDGSAELQVPRSHSRLVSAQSSLAHGFSGVTVETLSVATVKLDDEVSSESRIDFIKIDVEGHEQAVLRGGDSVLRRHLPPMLIEIEQRHMQVPVSDVLSQLEDMGYRVYYVDGRTLRPAEAFDVQRDQLSKITAEEFVPFSMPSGYVCNFCAVRDPALLAGLPLWVIK